MTYTPSPNKPGNTVAGPGNATATSRSNFGNLRVDAGRNAMTGANGNTFQTQDGAASPVTSPITVNTTQTLTVPLNAVSVLIISVTNAVQISEDSTESTYFSLPAANAQWIDCANQEFIYLKTGSSTVVSTLWKIV
jgi:hypothetical protein